MSAPARDAPEEKKKGVSKFLTRVKTVLKRGDGSKRLSFSGKPAVAGPRSVLHVEICVPLLTSIAPGKQPYRRRWSKSRHQWKHPSSVRDRPRYCDRRLIRSGPRSWQSASRFPSSHYRLDQRSTSTGSRSQSACASTDPATCAARRMEATKCVRNASTSDASLAPDTPRGSQEARARRRKPMPPWFQGRSRRIPTTD
jgi:hypothetical protein